MKLVTILIICFFSSLFIFMPDQSNVQNIIFALLILIFSFFSNNMRLISTVMLCYFLYPFILMPEKTKTLNDISFGINGCFFSILLFFSHFFSPKFPKLFNDITKYRRLLITKKNNHFFLTMTDIFFSKERNQDCPIEAKKIIVIQGKIENTNHAIISLTSNNFFVYDKSGKRLSLYPLFDTQEALIQIPMGRHETFQYTYALNDESNDIEIEYFPDITWEKPVGIWKITVTP